MNNCLINLLVIRKKIMLLLTKILELYQFKMKMIGMKIIKKVNKITSSTTIAIEFRLLIIYNR